MDEETGVTSEIISGWPQSFTHLVSQIPFTTPDSERVSHALGPIAKYATRGGRPTPLRGIIQEALPSIFEELSIPCRQYNHSKVLSFKRTNTISLNDARVQFGLCREALFRLKRAGHGFVDRRDNRRAVYLFDRNEIHRISSLLQRTVPYSAFAKKLGLPSYIISTLVEAGLLVDINDEACRVVAKEKILDLQSSIALFDRLASASDFALYGSAVLSFREAMTHQLNPWSWVSALKAVMSGKIRSRLAGSEDPFLDRLVVDHDALQRNLVQKKVSDYPAVTIPASVAAPILGLKDSAISKAIQVGLLPDTSLEVLAKFRADHVFPSEVRLWFGYSPQVFRNTMAMFGFAPAATVMNVHLWRRYDVENAFPESTKVNFHREWSQRKRNPESRS